MIPRIQMSFDMEQIWIKIFDLLKQLAFPLAIWYFEWRMEKRDDKREREYIARKKEQDRKDKMILRGLWILSDCQYEVIYDLKNGEHNGGLGTCMDEITKYRAEVKEWISDRAAWNQ